MAGLKEALIVLVDYGLYDVVLPFILIFTIFYASMNKIDFLNGDKRVYAIISFVVSFIAVASLKVIKSINTIIPFVGLFVIIIFCIILIGGLFGLTSMKENKFVKWSSIIFLMISSIFILISVFDFNFLSIIPKEFFGKIFSFLVGFAVFIFLILWITGGLSDIKPSLSNNSLSKKENNKSSKSDSKPVNKDEVTRTNEPNVFSDLDGNDRFIPEEVKRFKYN
jgi:hypothetical protein